MTNGLTIDVFIEHGQLKILLAEPDGTGYRLAGPKFSGNEVHLQTDKIDQRDADEIRAILNRHFPPTESDLL